MSLFYQSNISPDGVVGLWQVTENDVFFEDAMILFPSEIAELESLKARKRTEWLSSRYLLHLLSEKPVRGACLKDEFGKPYLEGADIHISISHTQNYTAVIASSLLVGIDVQAIVSKISRIAPKFINEVEWSYLPNEEAILYYHVIWGAKESMYKAYGRKNLDFRKEMKVSPFEFDPGGCYFEGMVEKGDFQQKFTLFCRQIEQLILVYAIQK